MTYKEQILNAIRNGEPLEPIIEAIESEAVAVERARVLREIKRAVIETKDTKDFATRMFQIIIPLLTYPDKPLTNNKQNDK